MSSHRARPSRLEEWHTYELVQPMIRCRDEAIKVMTQADPASDDYRLVSAINNSIIAALKRFAPEKADELLGIRPSAAWAGEQKKD